MISVVPPTSGALTAGPAPNCDPGHNTLTQWGSHDGACTPSSIPLLEHGTGVVAGNSIRAPVGRPWVRN